MFFLGVNFGENTDFITFVIIKKTLKNVKKHYHLSMVKQFPSGTVYSEIENEIIRIYNAREFIVNKRVFSQDRRPAKNVRAYPAIVADFTDADTSRIDSLRKKKIPVEGISVYNGDTWQKEDYGPICMGNDYYLPEGELKRNLSTVFNQNRLSIDDEISSADLIRKLTHLEMKEEDTEGRLKKSQEDVISALAMPVWFCENVRLIRRY